MKKLTLHVKRCYFEAMQRGEKRFEYRLANEHWRQRLSKSYDLLEICMGYPAKADTSRRLLFRFTAPELQRLRHPHFGAEEVEVLALPLVR